MPKTKTNADRKWRNGPPPHIGWWIASAFRDRKIWRWWNGREWSVQATPETSGADVARIAQTVTVLRTDEIEWTHDYPGGARVPRTAP